MNTSTRDTRSLRIIAIMATVTLLVPYAVLYWFLIGNEAIMGIGVYAVLWAVILPTGHDNIVLRMLDPGVVWGGIMFGIFNILFGAIVVRYCQGKTARKWVILSGILTLVIPLCQAAIYIPYLASHGRVGDYIGPIPIQLVVGLFIARRYAPQTSDSPWE